MTTRRTFLKASTAALVVGFRASALSAPAQKKGADPFDSWIRIDRNGDVTLIVAKSEMGQGVHTSLPVILAEELGADWKRVRVEQAPTDPSKYDLGTGGSGSVNESFLPLRRAGAMARQMLVAAAADVLAVAPSACRVAKGSVSAGGKSVTFGELVESASRRPLPDPEKVELKSPDDFEIIGKDVPRVDIPSKVDGSARFGIDVRVPGMLYAVIARCPTFGGKVARFDAARSKAVPGVRQVFEIPGSEASPFTAGGIAVVAESTWAAIEGRRALTINWDHGPHANESSESLSKEFDRLLAQEGKVVQSDGEAPSALGSASKFVEGTYDLPFQAHATMEPMNCTVDIRPDRAEAWVPTQGPEWALDLIAKAANLSPEKVAVHTTLMGGGFGRRYQGDFILEAAQVAKQAGAPVKLLWTREDDMQHDFYRPASRHRLRGALDSRGDAIAWHHRMTSTSIASFWKRPAPPESSEVKGAVGLPYAIPNVRVEYAAAASRVPVAWWRSVENSGNAFVVESFIDELAAAAKVDPLAFRLRLLSGIHPREGSTLDTKRLKGVLELAALKAGWEKPLPPHVGRGLAAFFSFASYVAEVAEVSVENGTVKVGRVVCAVDCGLPVSPDGVRAQVESAIVYGLSAALKGSITIAAGSVEQSNFNGFPVLRIDEMPRVEVHIVPSRERPTGIGEPGLPPIAPAVTNAIFALTGKRLRRLPIRREDLI